MNKNAGKWLGVAGGAVALLSLASGVHADTCTYAYDQFGRLVSVTCTTSGTITYTYDDAGNRTAQIKAP